MLINEFSKKTGLTREGIRFYEKIGLLNVKRRKENSYREYSDKDILRINFINDLKELGFTLLEIRDVMDLYNSNLKCKEIEKRLEVHLNKIVYKIMILNEIQSKLNNSIKICKENPNKKLCNIFNKFKELDF